MANIPSALPLSPGSPQLPPAARRTGLITVTALFFMWGFLTCLNDILIPHLKSVFELNYVQASLVQFTFFGAYFLMSIPSGMIIARLGYKRSMVVGLLTSAAGALLFLPAASYFSYPLFLVGLFVLASGITVLQVAANPYVAALGKPETASSRLTLAQAFNSLGTTLAPFFGGMLILAPTAAVAVSKFTEAASVKVPYLQLAGALVVLAIILSFIRLPVLEEVEEVKGDAGTWWGTLKIPHVFLGAMGIFLYVGAEVAIGSYLVNFMMDPAIGNLPTTVAASYLAYYWGGAMVGRFVGSALLQKIRANTLLAVFSIIAVVLSLVGMCGSGALAMWAVLAIGFFNSIMFPNIFTLGIAGLGHQTRRGSSILIMAIVGGAIVPVIMGKMADMAGVQHSLFIPALCYLYIVYYGFSGYRIRKPSVA